MTRGSQAFATIALCFLVALFEGIDLQAAGLAVPQVKLEFALAASQLGTFTAASSVGVLLGAVVGGRIADIAGRRSTLTIAVLIFAVASIATALAPSFPALVLARFVTGIGLGAGFPNLVALVSENSPERWKARAVAITYSAFPFGGGLASLIMAYVAVPGSLINGLLAMLGAHAGDWRAIFYVGGVAPLVAVPLILLVLPDLVEFAQHRSVQGASTPWLTVVFGEGRALRTILLWVSFFTTLMVLYLLLNWLPALLGSRGFDRHDAFLMQVAFNFGGIPGSLLAGAMLDGPARRLAVPLIYGGAAIFLGLTAIMPTDLTIALSCVTVLGAFIMGTQALLYGLAPACYHTLIRGTGIGAAVSVGRIGSVVGPLVAAGLVGAGHSAPQVLMAILPFALIGGLTAVLFSARLRQGSLANEAEA